MKTQLTSLLCLTALSLSLATSAHAQRTGAAVGQLSVIKQEITNLTTDVTQLNRDFSTHLQSQGCKPTLEETAVQEGLQALGESVNGLIKESSARISEQRILRAFHLVDYNAKDLIGLVAKAGYSKAFSAPLGEISEHISNLSAAGYNNPRVKLESTAQGGLFNRGGLFRKDDEDKPLLRKPPTALPPQHQPSQRPHTNPTGTPQRPIPRNLPEPEQQHQDPATQPSGGGLGDLLRTILRGGR